MWGQIANRDRPWPADYAGIKDYFNATKPWRNGPNNIRPISHNRRRTNEFIRERDGVYECVYHNTAVVTYHPDGTVALVHGGFQTVSTADFAHQYSPLPLRVNLDRYRVVASGYLVPERVPLVFKGGQYVSGAEPQKRLELDKTKAAAARKHPRLRELISVGEALDRLEGRLSLSAFRDTSSYSTKSMYWYLQGDDHEYDTALKLARVNDPDWLRTVSYFAFGAIQQVEVPLGTVLPPSAYDGYAYLLAGSA